MAERSEEYDYIIVGAGSAGCTLANRLSADRRCRVLLLEAGTRDSNPWIHVPAGFTKTLVDPKVNWLYETEPDEKTGNRKIPIPRGKVLGGSSSINGMLYIRGQHYDYDIWAQLGNRGWSFDEVLPYFKRSEHRESGGDDFHGEGGPLHVSDQVETHEVCDAVIAGAESLGIPRNDDVNGATQEGFGYCHLTVKDGKRHSAAKAYLDAARDRDNLDIATEALGKRVILDGKRAVGVEYSQYGEPRVARAQREVILSGGSVNSPQLLELSGIGQPQLLREHDIPVVHELPGVGENLQDHYVTRVCWRVTQPVTYNERSRGLNLLSEVLKYYFDKKGLLALSAASIVGFAKVREGVETPDVQFHMTPASFSNRKDRSLDRFPGMTMAPCQLRPESRGTIHIKSPDPFAPAAIRPNFLDAQTDRDTVVGGIQLARRIVATTALDPYRGVEEHPGPDVNSYDEILDYARQTGATVYHPVGTCKMGSDPRAVVDERLRVHGIEGLRVVDASIMPNLVSGNTNAPTIMIAEKASDIIREDAEAH